MISAEPVERLLQGYPLLYKRVRRWVLLRALSKYMRNALDRQRKRIARVQQSKSGSIDVALLDGSCAGALGAPRGERASN